MTKKIKIPTEYPYDDFPKLPPDGEIRKYPLVPVEWKFMCEDLGREIVKLKDEIEKLKAKEVTNENTNE